MFHFLGYERTQHGKHSFGLQKYHLSNAEAIAVLNIAQGKNIVNKTDTELPFINESELLLVKSYKPCNGPMLGTILLLR